MVRTSRDGSVRKPVQNGGFEAQEPVSEVGKKRNITKKSASTVVQRPEIPSGDSADMDEGRVLHYLDMIAPGIIQFNTDHYICGNTYRCVWALREYPTSTKEQAILRNLGEMDGVTLKIETRQVTPQEERKIITNAANKNKMKSANTDNLKETIAGNHASKQGAAFSHGGIY